MRRPAAAKLAPMNRTLRAVIMVLTSACTGDGTGPTPGVPVAYPSGGTTLAGLAAVDLLNDSRIDLITVDRDGGSIRLLPGRAGGAFGEAVGLTAGDDPIQATAGDVNGDGVPDLIVMRHLVNTLSVQLGLGGGALAPRVDYPLRNHGNRVVVVDLNGDGLGDLVAAHDGSGQPIYLTVFLGSRTGELHQLQELGTDYFTTEDLVAGDFDGDGHPDLAVATSDPRAAVLVFHGLGTGELAAPVALPTVPAHAGVSDGTTALATGDLNGDGLDDIVNVCFDLTNQLVVRLATASGAGFAAPVVTPLASPVDVALGDLDGDGRLDAVAANLLTGTVSVLHGKGDGTFEPARDWPVGSEPLALAVFDFDGDGLADIAATDLVDHAIRVLLSKRN